MKRILIVCVLVGIGVWAVIASTNYYLRHPDQAPEMIGP